MPRHSSHLSHPKTFQPDALARFRVIDAGGLITAKRPDLPPVVASFAARGPDDVEGESLVDVIRRFKPTALIGLAGAGRLFTPDVLRAVADVTPNPIVFAMSNPQSRMECTAEDAQKYTGGRAIFASGSPQADVTLACGSRRASSQCNNMYVFPGLAMGAHLGKTGIVSDGMLTAAAEALPSLILPEAREMVGGGRWWGRVAGGLARLCAGLPMPSPCLTLPHTHHPTSSGLGSRPGVPPPLGRPCGDIPRGGGRACGRG